MVRFVRVALAIAVVLSLFAACFAVADSIGLAARGSVSAAAPDGGSGESEYSSAFSRHAHPSATEERGSALEALSYAILTLILGTLAYLSVRGVLASSRRFVASGSKGGESR